MRHTIPLHKVCARSVTFDLDGDVVHNISFQDGCNGNLKAISKLADGMTVGRLTELLAGNICDDMRQGTSCADQFQLALNEAYKEEQQA